MASIYRFTSFAALVDTIQKSSLTLIHHSLWEDPYEGFIFQCYSHPGKREEIKKILATLPKVDISFAEIMLEGAIRSMHGQSWTSLKESDALWRIYSFDRMAVRLEIDKNDVPKLKGPIGVQPTVEPVKYVNNLSLEREVRDIFQGPHMHFGKALIKKRKAFSHEKEVRILTLDINRMGKSGDSISELISPSQFEGALKEFLRRGEITEEQYREGVRDFSRKASGDQPVTNPYIQDLSFSHISNFIKSVGLHPQSPPWFEETVETYCKFNNIEFLGRSDLYLLK